MPSATPENDVAMQEAEEQDGEAFILGDTKKLVVVSPKAKMPRCLQKMF